MSEYIYRAVDPRNDDDMKKYFALASSLSEYLKNNASFDDANLRWSRIRMGAVEYVDLNDWINKPLKPIEEEAQEFVFVCEKDGQFIGYIDFCDYHAKKDGEIVEDDIGAIHEIYVKEEFQNADIAFKLLQMAVQKLIEKGKNKAVMEVQEDNKNKFLHFALADGKVVETSKCKRKNGTETTSYTLLADLLDIQSLTQFKLAVKTAHMKKKMLQSSKNQEDCSV